MRSEYSTEGIAEYVLTLFPTTFTGVCVDVGAFDPFNISNSWIFERMGWDVYCIEPNPNCISKLKKYRENVIQYACGSKNKNNVDFYIFNPNKILIENPTKEEIYLGQASGTGLINHSNDPTKETWQKDALVDTIKVNVKTLDWLMKNEIKEDHIDYLSIDVEGTELDVLKGTNLELWKPKIIVIENIEETPDQRIYLSKKNYRHVYRISVNDIYILQDYYDIL